MTYNHKYISTIGIEYYWFGQLYIRIQEGTTTLLPDYALISTSASFYAKEEFKQIQKSGKLEEINQEEFLAAKKRAISIINKIISNMMEAIFCKCGKCFAACVAGMQDEEWKADKAEHLKVGCTARTINRTDFKFEACKCPKTEQQVLEQSKLF